jgi:probable HAF family extracellular repeat protein
MRLLLVFFLAVAAAGSFLTAAGGRESTRGWQIHELGALGEPGSVAVAVDEAGQVVGWADTPRRGRYGMYLHHAFLWQNGTMIDLGTLGGPNSEAVALNTAGQVVGVSDIGRKDKYGLYLRHAFLWQEGTMIDLGTFGGPNSEAHAINAAGQVVGEADSRRRNASVYLRHAFLWQDGRMRDLGTLDGSESWASAISDDGTVVGSVDGRAFKWRRGRMIDLHFPGPPLLTPGGRIARAFGKLSPPGAGYRGGTALALNEHGNTAG